MIRKLKMPRNPEMLGRLIASLRVLSGDRNALNDGEREIHEAMKAAGVDPAVAKRLLAGFDQLPKGRRSRLLGKFGERDFSVASRPRMPIIPPSVTMPAVAMTYGSDLHGKFGDIVSTDPDRTDLPIYTLRYQGFYCRGETSWDGFTNSDEIYVITSCVHPALDGTNHVRTERHPLGSPNHYADVDDFEQYPGPVANIWQNWADPVTLVATVFEQDYGDPDFYRDEVDTLVKAALALVTKYFPWAAALSLFKDTIVDGINWLLGTDDDIVSTEMVVLPAATLEMYAAVAPAFYVGMKPDVRDGPLGFPTIQDVRFTTNIRHHFTTTHNGGGATYVVAFDVLRDPALPHEPIIL